MRKDNSRLFILFFLSMLSAFGPFVMDMYLPTLPAMVSYFHTSPSFIQLSLTASMIGIAIGQLIFGPLSDACGRRSPLLIAMLLFSASTIGCLYAADIKLFITLRFIQGIAGAGGVVISRSIATDKYSGQILTSMLAIIGAVNGIATVMAPIGGGIIAVEFGWQGIFWALFIIGCILLGGSIHFRETLAHGQRQNIKWKNLTQNFKGVFQNRTYVSYVLQYGFTMAVLFINIASAPFIMQQHYALSPLTFSYCFGINAIAMIIATALITRFPTTEQALYIGGKGMLILSAAILIALSLECNFWTYEILLIGLLTTVGINFTASSALAMDCERKHAGTASACLGAIGYVVGSLVSPLVSIGNDTTITTGTLFLTASLGAYICTRFALHPKHMPILHKATKE